MKLNTVAVIWIVVMIVIAHAVAPSTYHWREHTISQLAAQRYALAWIMRAGFVGFGGLVVIGALQRLRRARATAYRDLPLLAYGLAMALAGIYSTRFWVLAVCYSPREASLHSAMATLAGVALSLAVLLCWLRDLRTGHRGWHGVALIGILGLSLAFGLAGRRAGLVQRALYLVGFAWLIYAERTSQAGTA